MMEQPLATMRDWDNPLPPPEKPAYMALSRTTDRVLQILLGGDLSRLRADSVAESLGMSSTTLRRRLRADHTCYQFLLDRARQYRCEQRLKQRWLPGKCLADELGYLEVNSFYRAFRRWTGLTYSEYKLRHFPWEAGLPPDAARASSRGRHLPQSREAGPRAAAD